MTIFCASGPSGAAVEFGHRPILGSRVAGGMVDYTNLPLPTELIERFKAWQTEFDDHEP
jgi:hypothetical protein